MEFRRSLNLLVLVIVVFASVASAWGIFSHRGSGKYQFHSLHGETVTIYGTGIYRYDSVSMASQAKAQDMVTLFSGIPFLLIGLSWSRKGLLKGSLLLSGILGYFLYTYASYTFLAMYNPLFLCYVTLMSASFFAFVQMMMSFDLADLSSCFGLKLPVNLIGFF